MHQQKDPQKSCCVPSLAPVMMFERALESSISPKVSFWVSRSVNVRVMVPSLESVPATHQGLHCPTNVSTTHMIPRSSQAFIRFNDLTWGCALYCDVSVAIQGSRRLWSHP